MISQKKEKLLHKFQILDDREALEGLTDNLRSERNQIKVECQEIIAQEVIKWRQKSRMKWLRKGDNNTISFHSSASARKRNNQILALIMNGSVCEVPQGIEEGILKFLRSCTKKISK